MEDIAYKEAVAKILETDTRYDYQAYSFLNEALTYTINKRETETKHAARLSRHITGDVLIQGVLEFAVKRYSFLAAEVFDYWNLHSSSDVGNVVYNLIGAGIMSASEDDRRADFDGIPDLPGALNKIISDMTPTVFPSSGTLPQIN